MSINSRRHRSSTAASNIDSESAAALQDALGQLNQTLRKHSEPLDLAILVTRLGDVQKCLSNSPETSLSKDVFRHSHGFSSLLDTLRAASGYYHTTKRTQAEKGTLFELLGHVLLVLSEVLRGHHGNRRYFEQRVEGGGWAALEQAIASIGFGGGSTDSQSENRLFGWLLAFAVDDLKYVSFFQTMQDHYAETLAKTEIELLDTNTSKSVSQTTFADYDQSKLKAGVQNASEHVVFNVFVEQRLDSYLSKTTMFINPDIIPTIIGFWKALSRGEHTSETPITLIIIQVLHEVSSLSKSNLLALHSTGIMSTLLPLIFEDDTPLGTPEQLMVEDLCQSLMTLGMSTLNDARYLLRRQTSRSADFLLRVSSASQGPSHIQFDLSLNGFASVELPTLSRMFPPSSSSPGYTFTAWIYIDRFDPQVHTTIFGAFDSSQTCFVLAYLEKDTQNFILQTSVTSKRPSVRFKSTTFQERKWYHIAVVHRRPRTITSSKAALYVNGEFAEQVKCQYPSSPSLSNASTDSFASFASSSTKHNPVQAFLGTPQDLSAQLGQGLVFSQWSLAAAHLFDDALSDDFISVHYRLGPRYNGNFQDCLGAFQTYEASAALGMRNDLIHPGKDEKSEIMIAIRDKAGTIVPEGRILLSILPSAVISDCLRVDSSTTQITRNLSHNASRSLYELSRTTGSPIAINAAVPSLNEALIRPNGTAILTGGPVVVVPQAVDNALWRLGGCAAIGLKLVQSAQSKEDIIRSVKILFQSVRDSWRNSEAMEKENGYAILAALIRGKVGAGTVISTPSSSGGIDAIVLSPEERDKLSFELLSLVLDFVGYDHAHPENSVINNPLAYRILLVDFDMWRKTAVITQKLYYKQFVIFGVSSKHHHFNSRRLLRMRKLVIAFPLTNNSHEVKGLCDAF